MKNPFLDIGDGNAVLKNKVVMILNAESSTLQKDTRNFIKKLNKENHAVMPKKNLRQINSFILCNAYGEDSLFSSSRSSKAVSENG
jgi:regulator of extracellular matrix RemA (YlzA/DUF370 family)